MFSIGKTKILNPSLIGKALHNNVDYLMYYYGRRQMKTLQLQVYIQNNDFVRNKKLNLGNLNVFSVIRNDFEYSLICWWMTFVCKSKLIRSSCRNGV